MLTQGQRHYAVHSGKFVGGVPLYEATCGEELVAGTTFRTAIGVNQGKFSAGTPIYGIAKCTQGQPLTGKRVVGVHQGKFVGALPVYAFCCCPPSLQSGSGSGSGSGAGPSNIFNTCCPGSPGIPQTLHATFNGCTNGGSTTAVLTWNGSVWVGTNAGTVLGCWGSVGQATFTLQCVAGIWTLFTVCSSGTDCGPSAGCSNNANNALCNPFQLIFTQNQNGCFLGCGCAVTITA